LAGRALYLPEYCPIDGAASKFLGYGQAGNFAYLLAANACRELADVEISFDGQRPLSSQDDPGGADDLVRMLGAGIEVYGVLVIVILLNASRMVFRSFESTFVDIDLISQLADSSDGRGKTFPAIGHLVIEQLDIQCLFPGTRIL